MTGIEKLKSPYPNVSKGAKTASQCQIQCIEYTEHSSPDKGIRPEAIRHDRNLEPNSYTVLSKQAFCSIVFYCAVIGGLQTWS